MNSSQAVVMGTLRPDGTLELDEKPDLPAARVQVTLRVLDRAGVSLSGASIVDVLDQIATDQAARGSECRDRHELDSDRTDLREEDDEYEKRWREIHAQTTTPLPPERRE